MFYLCAHNREEKEGEGRHTNNGGKDDTATNEFSMYVYLRSFWRQRNRNFIEGMRGGKGGGAAQPFLERGYQSHTSRIPVTVEEGRGDAAPNAALGTTLSQARYLHSKGQLPIPENYRPKTVPTTPSKYRNPLPAASGNPAQAVRYPMPLRAGQGRAEGGGTSSHK